MTHFRMRKADALNFQKCWECDVATIDEALLEFGHMLKAVLAIDGDMIEYVIQQRPEGQNNFKGADLIPVSVVNRGE